MSDRPEAQQRRLDSRCALALVVRVEASGLPLVSCQARNVSAGGMFLATDTPPELHCDLRLGLTLPGGRSATLRARVVHVLTAVKARSLGLVPGIGVRFEQLDQQATACIRELIEWATANAPLPRIRPGADLAAVQHDPMLGFLLGYVNGQRNAQALALELALELDTIERMLGELTRHGVVELVPNGAVALETQPSKAAGPSNAGATVEAMSGSLRAARPDQQTVRARASIYPPPEAAPEAVTTRMLGAVVRAAERLQEPAPSQAPTARATRPPALAQARPTSAPASRSQPPAAMQRKSGRPARSPSADVAAAAEAARAAAASCVRPSQAPSSAASSQSTAALPSATVRSSRVPAAGQSGRDGVSQLPAALQSCSGRPSAPSSRPTRDPGLPLGAAAQVLAQAEAAFQAGQAMEAIRHLQLLGAMTFNDARVQQRASELKQQVLRAAAVDLEKQAAHEERQQHWEQAAKLWLRVAEGRPKDGLPLQRAALAQLQAGVELRLVMETARRAVQVAPNDAQAHRTLAKVYRAADMQASAERELEAARRCAPGDTSEESSTGLLKRLLGRDE